MSIISMTMLVPRNEEHMMGQFNEVLRSGGTHAIMWIPREMSYEFSSLETLEMIKKTITLFESHGIEVIVWLGETCGHNGGTPDENPPYTPVRSIESGDSRAFCVTDEKFIKAFGNWLCSLAEVGAKAILIDDDWRMNFRYEGFGCCCKNHMAAFTKELGEDFDEKDIASKVFNGGKSKYRDAWIKAQSDGMLNFAKRMRQALDTVNPETRLGFCCNPSTWSVDCTNVPEVAKAFAGNTKPFLRTTAGPYWVVLWHNDYYTPKTLGEVVELTRVQADWCKDFDVDIISEGDTYPKPRFTTPAAYLECYDMALRAADENIGILKSAIDVRNVTYEPGYVDAMVRNKPHYDWIEKHFYGKKCVGVTPYNNMFVFPNAELDCNSRKSMMYINTSCFVASAKFIALTSTPTAYGEDGISVIFGESGRYAGEKELKNGAIIDISAAKFLAERGYDVGIEDFTGEAENDAKDFFDLTFHRYIDEDYAIRLNAGGFYHNPKLKDNVTVLTEFVRGEHRDNGIFTYENADGMRFMVLPFDVESVKEVYGWLGCYSLRRLVNNNLEWLGRKPVPVLLDTDAPECYLVAKEDENTITVGVWNMHADKIENAKFIISGDYSDVEFYACDGVMEDGYVTLKTTVYPYEFAAFELKKRK